MPHIAILLSSVRDGRNSERVALYFQDHLGKKDTVSTEVIDLLDYDFTIFHERLKHLKEPSTKLLDYAGRIKRADGVLIVTPEYNGGYPAALKNAIDVLYDEWRRKPIAIATVSDGSFGGTQVITSLLFTLWKMHSWPVPRHFPVPKAHEAFDEAGMPRDPELTAKRVKPFIDELLWCVEARRRMEE